MHKPLPPPRRHYLLALLSTAVAAVVSACKSSPRVDVSIPTPVPTGTPQSTASADTATIPNAQPRSSSASTPRAYRQDGASHLYALNAGRIYKGKLPPLLYAVGVLDVHINKAGAVTLIDWVRAPRHAPEVMAEIARTVQRASPFPAPSQLGAVVYTDTWLWHESGRFQLDTLTEGQT